MNFQIFKFNVLSYFNYNFMIIINFRIFFIFVQALCFKLASIYLICSRQSSTAAVFSGATHPRLILRFSCHKSEICHFSKECCFIFMADNVQKSRPGCSVGLLLQECPSSSKLSPNQYVLHIFHLSQFYTISLRVRNLVARASVDLIILSILQIHCTNATINYNVHSKVQEFLWVFVSSPIWQPFQHGPKTCKGIQATQLQPSYPRLELSTNPQNHEQ